MWGEERRYADGLNSSRPASEGPRQGSGADTSDVFGISSMNKLWARHLNSAEQSFTIIIIISCKSFFLLCTDPFFFCLERKVGLIVSRQ